MRAAVMVGGEIHDSSTCTSFLRFADLIVAADGGAQHVLRLGFVPHVVVGDMDSLDGEQAERLRQAGCRLLPHPVRKNETDSELAILHAVEQGVDEITILGALGGRLDHTMANVLLLSLPELRGVRVRLVDGQQEAILIQDEGTIQGRVGDTVSLLPVAGDAEGITTQGLEYALNDSTLIFGRTRGVSNVLTAPTARVRLRKGALLCVRYSG
ncbi:MAG: thiamine diphosphokinase [Chloroflexota bacterium]|nr:thiamine diphosphokinase [Chloroflexota bacterium]